LNKPRLRRKPGSGTTVDDGGDSKDKSGSDAEDRPTLKRRN
jgi:hypothetical protein